MAPSEFFETIDPFYIAHVMLLARNKSIDCWYISSVSYFTLQDTQTLSPTSICFWIKSTCYQRLILKRFRLYIVVIKIDTIVIKVAVFLIDPCLNNVVVTIKHTFTTSGFIIRLWYIGFVDTLHLLPFYCTARQ